MDQIAWPLLIPGIVIALFGWVLYWTGIRIVGAFLGAGAGLVIALLAGTHFDVSSNLFLIMCIVGLLAGAAAGLFLIQKLHNYFFFFMGALIGAPIGLRFLAMEPVADQAWSTSTAAQLIAPALGALIGGVALLRARRYVVALAAALIGSTMIAVSLPYERGALIAIPCFITSMVVQTGLIRSFLPEERVDKLIPRQTRARGEQA